MWSEVLKILPRVEPGELRKMENDLSKRFANVAKKFGGGLKNAVLGGGILAIAGGLLNKLLSPLQSVQETIEKTLSRADDISVNAKEFGTSEGKLFKLQQVGKTFGIDENTLNTLLTKFQTALVASRVPGAPQSAVSAFSGEKDTVDAFFKFANSMKNAPKDTQVLAQQEVFGERVAGKARELFQNDLVAQLKLLGGKSSAEYTPIIQKASSISDLNDLLKAQTDMNDFIKKSGKITEGMVIEQNRATQIENQKETDRLNSYKDLKQMSNTMNEMELKIEEGVNFVINEFPSIFDDIKFSLTALKGAMDEGIGYIKTISVSPFFRGITSTVGSWFK